MKKLIIMFVMLFCSTVNAFRIPSAATDRDIAFVAVDSIDFQTRETGLSSFTIFYTLDDGGSAIQMTTPTVGEISAANMPGVYMLSIDESGMTTLTAGHDTEELVLHITNAAMAPVTRVIEIYRPDTTEGESIVVDSSGNAAADVIEWRGGVIPVQSITGVPEVDVTHWIGTTTTLYNTNPVVSVDDYTVVGGGGQDVFSTLVDEAITANGDINTIAVDVAGIDGAAMRGTDSALLAANINVAAGVVESNILQTNGNTTPIVNWEDTYDGTGYTDDNAPAKQIQVSGITNSGAPSNEHAIAAPDGFTILNGLNELNTEDDTHADNGTLHSLDNDGANILDCYYVFDIGGAFTPSDVVWRGRAFGNNDDLTVSINTGTIAAPSWQERSIVTGSNSSVIIAHTFILFTNDTMTGVDAGKVALRFNGTGLSSATLFTDQIICQKTPKTDNTGYAGGQVWYNSSASNTNTVPDVDGTARNPVSTWAAALTLSGSLNITDFHIINGSTVQLTSDSSNFSLFGDNWTLDLNGQIITSSHFSGASNVSGVSTGTGYDFHDSSIMNASFEAGDFIGCIFSGDVTLTAAGIYLFKECASHIAGTSTPSFDFENANENKEINIRGYDGGVEFKNFGHGTAVHTCSFDGTGQYILNVNCSNANADDVFAVRGEINDTDNVAGGWNGTISDDARYDVTQIDDTITGNTIISDIPNISEFEARTLLSTTYFAPAIDIVANVTLVDTTTTNTDMRGTDAAATSTKQDTMETTLNDVPTTAEFNARTIVAANYFDPSVDSVEITATGGTAGKNAEELVDDTWDEVINKAAHNVANSAAKALRQADISITSDTAQGPGTGNNQIQLATGASSVDGAYDPARVFIKDGTGMGQSRNIFQYDGATRTATVDRNWKVNPDATSEYIVMSDAGREHINEGLAQGGTSTTIVLNTLASTANNTYKNQNVFIRSGTGEDQVRRVISYVGATRVATVSEAWDVSPDTTSGYAMLPFACVEVQAIKNQELSTKTGINFDTFFDASGATTTTEVPDIDKVPKSDGTVTLNATALASIADAIWDEPIAGHDSAATFGSYLELVYAITFGDFFTDTTTTPWQEQRRRTGTATSLSTRNLLTTAGGNVTNTSTPIGRKTAP